MKPAPAHAHTSTSMLEPKDTEARKHARVRTHLAAAVGGKQGNQADLRWMQDLPHSGYVSHSTSMKAFIWSVEGCLMAVARRRGLAEAYRADGRALPQCCTR